MQTKVLKFGGSSLADAVQFRKAADIIRADDTVRYVVVSAPGKRFDGDEKVTDLLYRCAQLAEEGQDIGPAFDIITERYRGIITDLGLSLSLEADFSEIRAAVSAGAGRDYTASRGEYLNGKIMAALLGFAFLDAKEGIFFDDAGNLDATKTYAVLPGLLAAGKTVVPGFYGATPQGAVRTFSRGGSDITGAIVARAAQVDVYENWTDVSGMLMADPRIVENPRVIETITYRELRELAYMGATVMHDEAIFPVREVGIPINIRNTNAPGDPGTWIVAETAPIRHSNCVITGVAGHGGFRAFTIAKDRMNNEVGFGRKVLQILEDFNISFEHIPSGIDTISVIIAAADIAGRENEIISRIFRETGADSVHLDDALALIAVVGRGMTSTKGTAGRIFRAIAAQDVNIRMIDQGSSENNIIIGVGEADCHTAIRAIYSEFVKEGA